MISPRTFSRTVPAAAVAVLAASVTLAACTASSGGSGKAASGDEAAPSASSGPPALTPEAYRSALDAAGRPARTTLAAIAKARTFRSLHQRIGRAESALESALERLGGAAASR